MRVPTSNPASRRGARSSGSLRNQGRDVFDGWFMRLSRRVARSQSGTREMPTAPPSANVRRISARERRRLQNVRES